MNDTRISHGSAGLAIEHAPVSVAMDSIVMDSIAMDSIRLEGDLSVPTAPKGAVLFAHGSGSSRHSPRNRYVADVLNEGGLATLLIDLLTADEQEVDLQTAHLRFDIPFLARRLTTTTEWLSRRPEVRHLKLGHFGASTGAAAALVAAAEVPRLVSAVVSRGGRPDLAGAALARVDAPTLLIVGAADPVVLDLNRKALALLRCEKQLQIIPGAGHLFEQSGALQKVSVLARDWFLSKLANPAAAPSR
ncbi:MAG TPA: dienelactone hydrolase family protein [Bryobacteraceae bacterium]|nr:dienelactone hydrolase family protein [Bryobacteraceae bacterium]